MFNLENTRVHRNTKTQDCVLQEKWVRGRAFQKADAFLVSRSQGRHS